MNVKAVIPLVAGLAIAGVAGKMGFDSIKRAQGAQVRKLEVWAAAVDIPRGATINDTMLRPMIFPEGTLPAGAFTDKSKLVGRVPRIAAPAGLPVLDSMLSPSGTRPGVLVPEGFRAVAVKIDESSGVDNHLQPGARVDVVGYFNLRTARGAETVARTIIENVEVAAVGDRISAGVSQPADPSSKEKDARARQDNKPARAVVLLVKPDRVPTLHLAEQRGKIKLSMRNVQEGAPEIAANLSTSESDVLGLSQPGDNANDPNKPSMFEQFMKGWTRKSDTAAEPAPVPAPIVAAPTRPKPAWQMMIHNGDRKQTLGWLAMDSREPIDLTAEEFDRPSLFDDGPRRPARKSVNPPTPAPQPEPQPEPLPEPEPEESPE